MIQGCLNHHEAAKTNVLFAAYFGCCGVCVCVCVSEQLTFSGGGGMSAYWMFYIVSFSLWLECVCVWGGGGGACLHIECFILSVWQDPLGAEGGKVGGWVKWGGG